MKRGIVVLISVVVAVVLVIVGIEYKKDGGNYKDIKTKDTAYCMKIDLKNGKLKIDYEGDKEYGIVVIGKSGSNINNSYIINKGTEQTIEFTYGQGDYDIKICEYIGNRELRVRSEYTVTLSSDKVMEQNIGDGYYVVYNEKLNKIIEELITDDSKQYVENVYQYIIDNIEYDNELANKIGNNEIELYKPNIYNILESKKAICVGQASLMVSMLRITDIPARVVTGYLDNDKNTEHAWVEVYIDKEWRIYDTTLRVNYKNLKGNKYIVKKYY